MDYWNTMVQDLYPILHHSLLWLVALRLVSCLSSVIALSTAHFFPVKWQHENTFVFIDRSSAVRIR